MSFFFFFFFPAMPKAHKRKKSREATIGVWSLQATATGAVSHRGSEHHLGADMT